MTVTQSTLSPVRCSVASARRCLTRSTALSMTMLTLLALPLMPDSTEAQTTRERGFGPYTLITRRGEATVRILRRDGDIVWVDRLVQSGAYVETGVPRSEIMEFKAPRPALFDQAEKVEKPEEVSAIIDQLRRLSAQLRPYRDLPGISMNEALILQAKLNEKREYWRDALLIYQELMNQPYDYPGKNMVRYWAGINLWKMNQKEKALEYLMDEPIPDEDMDLFSDILFMRANSYSELGRHREAVDTYLQMIVFYPYYRTNELRALSGILTNYIALQDWDATTKSLEALKLDYAEAPQTLEAEAMLQKYQEQLEKERQFKIVEE